MKRSHTGHRVGECHQRAKLTDEQVKLMREKYERAKSGPNPRGYGYGWIASMFNVSPWTARDIVTYRTRP